MSDSPDGARTSADGTPMAVDLSGDRGARGRWLMVVGGPLTWITHFMLVYLVVEAGCSGDGQGLDLLDPPVPAAVTLGSTAVAALLCVGFAAWSYRHWTAATHGTAAGDPAEPSGPMPDRDPGGTLAFAGLLLSLLSFVAVLFVGLPALVLQC